MNAQAIAVPIVPKVAFKRILYATDFSQASTAALPLVSTIARKYASQVLVANIWMPVPYAMITPEVSQTLEQAQLDDAHAQAGELLKSEELRDLSATTIVQAGIPTEELDLIVRNKNIDLAILGTHGRTGVKHLLMGSVAEELVRRLPCPVLTVGPNVSKRSMQNREIKHILFPTDLSSESQAVFPYLASLALEYGALITVMHVLPVETRMNPDARVLAEPLRKEMQNTFYPHIDPRTPVEFVIEFGDAAERILAQAESGKADLIGLSVRKAAEITTHFRNTVAYRVLLGARCPVLTSRAVR